MELLKRKQPVRDALEKRPTIILEKPLVKSASEGEAPIIQGMAHRYKSGLQVFTSTPTLLQKAATAYVQRLKARSEAPWVQLATQRYKNRLQQIAG